MRYKSLAGFLLTLILTTAAWAGSETVLYNFNGYTGDGYYPYSALIADSKGNLYGTTESGGNGYGTVFELKLSGGTYSESLLYAFTGEPDGAYPEYSSLVFDKAGNLYGTTANGGTDNLGTVFELKESGGKWTETILHSFTGSSSKDGYMPQAGLSFDSAGNMYGTTEYGGASNAGSVFQFKSTNGKLTYKVIHSFASPNAYYPVGGITPGAGGYYYGTTYYGGKTFNAGTVYRLFQARGVWVSQTVYTFTGGADGTDPDSSLSMDSKGNMYGVTYQGGVNNLGTVYELKAGKNNKYTHVLLYSFKGGNTDGEYPWYATPPAIDSKGDLFGTTRYGSTSNQGTVWELKLSGTKFKESVPWTFGSSGDGDQPLAGVIIVKGKVIGTTYAGGKNGAGTAFSVTP